MVRKREKKVRERDKPSTGGRQAKRWGLVAAVLGGLSWLVGGFTRENAAAWIKNFLFALVLVLFVRWLFVEPFKIPSGSMRPTFMEGDRIFVNKLLYGVRVPFMNKRLQRGSEPHRWDIVVFRSVETDAKHKTLVKRVVGLPGERIHISGGEVYVNGKSIVKPAHLANIYYTSAPQGFTDMRYGLLESDAFSVVPPDQYLMLGDNSGHSRDGRTFGWVPHDNILGRVWCVWWPVTRWRDFTGFSHTWWWRAELTVLGLLIAARVLLGRSWRIARGDVCETLAEGDHIFVNHYAFGLTLLFPWLRLSHGRIPRRGELVLYYPPSDHGGSGEIFMGRVAAFPGEHVHLKDGDLLVNGTPVTGAPSLDNRAFHAGTGPFGKSRNKAHSVVPANHYFILSEDGRDNADSRRLGWIAHNLLIGPVAAVWWPPTRWRRVRP